MKWVYNDGGRKEAGYKGETGDCVVRAIAIATGRKYQEVYDLINNTRAGMRQTKKIRGSNARTGTHRKVYEKLLKEWGWKFIPTMGIGSGCKVHLKDGELPMGRIIARVSRHVVAIVDGVIQDNHDCSREGTRCVYGYYALS